MSFGCKGHLLNGHFKGPLFASIGVINKTPRVNMVYTCACSRAPFQMLAGSPFPGAPLVLHLAA